MDKIHLVRFTGKYKKTDKDLINLNKTAFYIMEDYNNNYDIEKKNQIGFISFMENDIGDDNIYYNSLFHYKASEYDYMIFETLSDMIKDKFDIIEINTQKI